MLGRFCSSVRSPPPTFPPPPPCLALPMNRGTSFQSARLSESVETNLGFGKRGSFGKGGLFRKVHSLEILENLEILEILESRQTLDCAMPGTISAIPPYCALWGFWCLNMANWMRYPLPLFLSVSPLESMRSGGAIPPLKRGISAILAQYPLKTRQMGAIPPSAILSRKGIA